MADMDDQLKAVTRPEHVPPYAEACLRALAERGFGEKLSLGGGLGLLHYLDYRPTYDVAAWWAADTTPEERNAIIRVIEDTLRSWGAVDVRAWGEVTSLELSEAGERVFSFQIADRSAKLEPSTTVGWLDFKLDSLPDLIASKMVALVERGAPRDFRDIHAACSAGLVTERDCWKLWAQRQRLSGSDTNWTRARLAVETHLKRLALHRPLEQISDPGQRSEAARVRHWYREVFLHAIPA